MVGIFFLLDVEFESRSVGPELEFLYHVITEARGFLLPVVDFFVVFHQIPGGSSFLPWTDGVPLAC